MKWAAHCLGAIKYAILESEAIDFGSFASSGLTTLARFCPDSLCNPKGN